MLNRKLFEVISQMSTLERKRLRMFLDAPYFNHGTRAKEIVRLYDLILKYEVNEHHPALSKKQVFNLFYPDKPFVEKSKGPLDSLTSDLFGLLRRFLAQIEKEQEDSEVSEYLALARFYRKHAYDDRFWKTIETLRTLQQNSEIRDSQYYFWQYQIEEQVQKFSGMHNSFEDDANLHAVHRNLDIYYSILKLEYACSLVYQNQNVEFEKLLSDPLMDLVMTMSDKGERLDIPINRIYKLLTEYLCQSDPLNSLEELEILLNRHKPLVKGETYKNFMAIFRFLSLRNYWKVGDDRSLKQFFDVNKKHLVEGYFYIDKAIPFSSFRNLVVTALKLGEFDWTKKFLETHGPDRICGTRYPVEVHSLNMAEYYFGLKDYDQALSIVVYRLFENPTIGIAVDVLILKIYFETKNDLLEPRMKALEQKIRRSPMNKATKNRYLNFLKMLHKITRYGWLNHHPKRSKWLDEIKNTQEIVGREWLLEKLSE